MSEMHEIGYSKTYEITVTKDMVQKYAEVTGDFNPIHVDEDFAKATKFGKCIAHGMLIGGFFSRALVETFGGSGIYLGQDLKFTNPVFVGDTILVQMTLVGLRKEKLIGTVETTAKRKSNGDLCVKGQAVIMMAPPR
ncbi:MAG: MaoC family dehydratase [Bdellovibrionales bacterium]